MIVGINANDSYFFRKGSRVRQYIQIGYHCRCVSLSNAGLTEKYTKTNKKYTGFQPKPGTFAVTNLISYYR